MEIELLLLVMGSGHHRIIDIGCCMSLDIVPRV